MPYQKVENWKFGLDARRSELTSQPGTLQQLTNGHINQGGEIEKRKAFFAQALPTGTGYTFGMQPTGSGITVFGSAAAPGAFPITFVDTIGPTVISYQQLKHPTDVLNGTTNTVPMTAIIWSTAFAGQTWAVAKFNDGNIYGYYNGSIIKDFTNGLVLTTLSTNAKIATELTAEINATNLYTATALSNTFSSFSQPGATYQVTDTVVSGAGTLTDAAVSVGTPAVPSTSAVGQFSVIAGTVAAGTNKITSIKVNAVEILGASIDFVTDANHTATALATQINVFQTNYIATVALNVVTLTALASVGATPNGFEIVITAAGNVCTDNCLMSFSLASGASAFTVNNVFANGVDLLNGTPVTWNTNLSTTVSDIAAAIVLNSGTSLFTGLAIGNTLYISRLVTRSGFPSVSVTVNFSATGTGGVVQGTTAALSSTLSVNSVNGSYSIAHGNVVSITAPVTAYVFGGSPPYYFSWTLVKISSTTGVAVSFPANPYGQTTTFSPTGVNGTDTYVCNVTDSVGTVVASNSLSVTMTGV